jgi:hypothetical protein
MNRDPWHWLSCNKIKPTTTDARHNRIAQLLVTWAKRAGAQASDSSILLSHVNGRRTDLLIDVPQETIEVDVTVRHPLAPSHIAQTLADPHKRASVLKAAEVAKKSRYEQVCRAKGHTFLPFAVETMGAFGAGAKEVMQRIVAESTHSQLLYTPYEVTKGLQQSIAVAVQVGNARAVIAGLHLMSKTNGIDGA